MGKLGMRPNTHCRAYVGKLEIPHFVRDDKLEFQLFVGAVYDFSLGIVSVGH